MLNSKDLNIIDEICGGKNTTFVLHFPATNIHAKAFILTFISVTYCGVNLLKRLLIFYLIKNSPPTVTVIELDLLHLNLTRNFNSAVSSSD